MDPSINQTRRPREDIYLAPDLSWMYNPSLSLHKHDLMFIYSRYTNCPTVNALAQFMHIIIYQILSRHIHGW